MYHSISSIQTILQNYDIDAWAMYDFRGINSIAWHVLGLKPDAHCTRRFLVVIPKNGRALKLVSRIEAHTLAHVDADEIPYSTHEEWHEAVAGVVRQFPRLAMEYSPNNDIPVASKVDGGTLEFLRELGAEISSSADITQHCTAVMKASELDSTLRGADALRSCMQSGLDFLRRELAGKRSTTEFAVQQHIMEKMRELNLETDHPPIVAIGPHAANPHYAPQKNDSANILPGDVVLLDMWARPAGENGYYSDITWMAFAGEDVPKRPQQLFGVIAQARDAVIELLNDNIPAGKTVRGFELDDIARRIVNEAGYGAAFVHRTGHSITRETHGSGANLDNFETHDTREILPGTTFSIEPGIYLRNDIGLRTEVDIVIMPDRQVVVTGGPAQKSIVPLMGAPFDITAPAN